MAHPAQPRHALARSDPQAASSPLGPLGPSRVGIFAERRILFDISHPGKDGVGGVGPGEHDGAVAIENARMIEEVIEKERMEEELSIARDLQVSMLPAECPTVAGFDIAAYSVSAREVGGDFYDFIEMDETGYSNPTR